MADRLTRDEFMRRYEAMPELKKAELIEGVVYVPSPVSQQYHGDPHSCLVGFLSFTARGPRSPDRRQQHRPLELEVSAPQPDVVLFIEPERGGQVKLDEKGYIVGVPDLVAEISATTVSHDLHDKLQSYERNGVREYIVSRRVLDHEVDWFVLPQSTFRETRSGG